MASPRSKLDVGRMAEAVKRPGIDPRVWITWARVIDRGADGSEGPFVDVEYLPDGDVETALVGAPYSGDDYGAWWPLEDGDIVLVAVPSGEPGLGPVVISRVWNSNQAAFDKMKDGDEPTGDVWVKIKSGRAYNLRSDELADIRGGKKGRFLADLVELAKEGAGQAFVRGDAFAGAFKTFLDAFNAKLTTEKAFVDSINNAATGDSGSAKTTHSSEISKLQTALTAFKNALSVGQSLSSKIKGD